MSEQNEFQSTVQALFGGMEGFLSSKTVVGEPIHVDSDTTLVPLMDVTFGIGAGANQGDRKNPNTGGGIGGKMTPSAILVISGGTTKLINVKSSDGITKVLDMVPDMVNKFTKKKGAADKVKKDKASKKAGGTVEDIADDIADNIAEDIVEEV